MNHMENVLENQQQVNNAAVNILNYFDGVFSYTTHLEQMIDAQTQIIALMDLAKQQMLEHPDTEPEYQTDQIAMFLRDVQRCHKLLEPFAEMLRQR